MTKFYLFAVALLATASINAQTLVYRTHFSNGQAQDVSGNNFHGVVAGNPVACPGYSGIANTAVLFDGVNDMVTLPSDPAFNLSTWTLQALVRPDAFYAGECQVSTIIWHGMMFQPQHYSLRFCDNWYDNDCATNTNMEAADANAAGTSATPNFHSDYYDNNGFCTTGQWYCLTGTYDGDSIKLYIDGELIVADAFLDQYNYTFNEPTYIGYSTHGSLGFPYWFTGAMDELSIWNGVVNFNSQNPGLCDTFDAASVRNVVVNDNHVRIYPSPATEDINIELSSAWSGATVYIMNGIGQLVTSQKATGDKMNVNIQNLPSGVYITKVVKDGQTIVERFVKK